MLNQPELVEIRRNEFARRTLKDAATPDERMTCSSLYSFAKQRDERALWRVLLRKYGEVGA